MHDLQLETPRLYIRPLVLDDLADFYDYRSKPEVAQYQGFDVFSWEEAKRFIEENSTKSYGTAGEWVQYAIESKLSGRLLGDCAIQLYPNDVRIAQVGLSIHPQEQQKGYAKEALSGILDFLFANLGIHRVVETVDVENTASIRLLESLGFRREGHFVENIFFKGKWGSEYQYALLKQEWARKS
jgi:RimJ/RimL family protein N-acetyltransferase